MSDCDTMWLLIVLKHNRAYTYQERNALDQVSVGFGVFMGFDNSKKITEYHRTHPFK